MLDDDDDDLEMLCANIRERKKKEEKKKIPVAIARNNLLIEWVESSRRSLAYCQRTNAKKKRTSGSSCRPKR
jgi:hypothetical protein